ncbi:MAG: TIGR02281 family clan AA aspartic protease [Xanthomonadales bacterium]|nr:TIGR02281 family clan AA aspartic protease [Xanthomonadales bacterium]
MSGGNGQDAAPLGRAFLWLAALGLLAGLTFLFQAADRDRGRQLSGLDDSGRAMVVLERDRSGHYLAEGAVNGHAMMFLVDTGATDVAIPEQTARAIGLSFGPEVGVMTAAGPVTAWRTRLDRVQIGGLVLENVRALITRGPMREALLGMSFLRHFSLSQDGGQLIIGTGETG